MASPKRERRATPRAEIEQKTCLSCAYTEAKRRPTAVLDLMTAAPPLADGARLSGWQDELERLVTRFSALPPQARQAVRHVLTSLRLEQGFEGAQADELLRALAALTGSHGQTSGSPEPPPFQGFQSGQSTGSHRRPPLPVRTPTPLGGTNRCGS